MRVDPSAFINFNQMLVVSVLVHCLFMTLVLFLPKTRLTPETIQPSFFVELVDVSSLPGAAPAPKTGDAEKETAPVKTAESTPKQTAVKKKTAVKKELPKVAVPPVLLESAPLEELSKSPGPGSKSLVQELDQVAKLDRTVPLKKKTAPPPVLEQNIRDLESLKTAPEVTAPRKKTAPRDMEATLQQFESLQLEDLEPAPSSQSANAQPETVPQDLTLEELEFAMLAQQKVETRTERKTPIDPAMMKALMALEEMKKQQKPVAPELAGKIETTEETEQVIHTREEAQQVLEKLARLSEAGVSISFEMNETATTTQPLDFKSEVWAIEAPKLDAVPKGKTGTMKATKQTFVFKGQEGRRSGPVDPLSRYVGLVHRKVYENWRNPLGAGHSEVKVSFFIFREGNISNPDLTQSSGNAQLDRLALLAVKDSQPFPPFPGELNEPNLRITINFKYVHKR